MLEKLDHGWPGFLTLYLLTALGLALGLPDKRVLLRRLPSLAITALPVMIGVIIVWAIVGELGARFLRRLPDAGRILFGMAFVVASSALTARVVAQRRGGEFYNRGTVLLQGASTTPKRSKNPTSLSVAGQSIPSLDEMKHFKFLGTTGTGKSTAIRELIGGALERGDRAVIADPDGNFVQHFYDPARGDAILNPFNDRAHRWDLFAEILQPQDADQLARSLIPDYEGSDRNWRHYARTFVTAILRQLHRIDEHDAPRLYYLL